MIVSVNVHGISCLKQSYDLMLRPKTVKTAKGSWLAMPLGWLTSDIQTNGCISGYKVQTNGYHTWLKEMNTWESIQGSMVLQYNYTYYTTEIIYNTFAFSPLSIFVLNTASLPDPTSLLQFSRNLLALGVVGDSLSAMVTKAESECRELIYSAEEDMEGTE